MTACATSMPRCASSRPSSRDHRHLVDLQGPKLRIGKFESGAIRLTEGDVVSFVRRESVGGLGRVHLPHPEIFQAVQPGHTMLLDDGKFSCASSRRVTSGSTPR